MADIVSRNKIGVVKAGSLHARMAQQEVLKETASASLISVEQLPNQIAVMIDLSGSMAGEPVELLEKALQDFIAKSIPSTTAIAVESFPSGVSAPFSNDKLLMWTRFTSLRAGGGTPMADAMRRCLTDDSVSKMTRAIIISDGMPDSVQGALDQAQQYKEKNISIDTIHIGESSSGERVLREIAELTGGIFVKFSDQTKFSQAFAYLLPETRAQAARLMLTAGADEVR